MTIRQEPLLVRDHNPSSAWVSVGGAGAVVEIAAAVMSGAVDDVVVSDELVVESTTVVDEFPDVVGCSGVDEDAAPEQAASVSRDA